MRSKSAISFERRGTGPPMLVAGPCSAETEKQLLATARELVPLSPAYFRAGIWKPRTRPGNFEGVGLKGLHWLNAVQKKYGLRVVTEVANGAHVESCLEMGIDALWIGARTTVNPFSVQEIANAIRGTGIPVFIKNPVNPDIGLWIGAIERIRAAGSENTAAVHRGFSFPTKSIYRNPPLWEIPIELKRLLPEIPVLCDPSHISGHSAYLSELCQKAIDLSFDGLMVEAHMHPQKALSDAAQQITPKSLHHLLSKLIIRKPATDDVMVNHTLQVLRERIDVLDDELIELVSRRMEIVEQIADYKKENHIAILQEKRWAQILESRQMKAKERGLSAELFLKMFEQIHQESIHIQTIRMNNNELEKQE